MRLNLRGRFLAYLKLIKYHVGNQIYERFLWKKYSHQISPLRGYFLSNRKMSQMPLIDSTQGSLMYYVRKVRKGAS